MAVSLKHAFNSGVADGGDTSLVQPSNWNAEHALLIDTSKIVGRTTAGTGSAEEIGVSTELTLASGTLGVASSLGGKTFTGDSVISVNSASNALRITQTGAGNALLVEDDTNPDGSPFVVNTDGRVLVGLLSARSNYLVNQTPNLQIEGDAASLGLMRNQSGSPPVLSLASSRSAGGVGGNTILLSGDRTGIISFEGADGTNLISSARIEASVDGTPSSNVMPGRLTFSTATTGGTLSERMRIDSGGDVGIGVTNPTAKLDIAETGSQTALRITNTGTGNSFLVEDSASTDANPFVIDANGNVLIGNQTAQAGGGVLQIGGGSTTSSANYVDQYSYANSSRYTLRRANASTTILASGDTVGEYSFAGYDGAAYRISANISSAVDGTPGSADMPGRLVFATTADGAGSPSERMRISSSGNVLVGTTTNTDNSRLVLSAGGNSRMLNLVATDVDSNVGFGLKNDAREWTNGIRWDLNDAFVIRDITAGVDVMTLATSGNVGIGTTAPGSALDVKGTIRLSGATSGYVGLAPAAAAGSTTYTLPSADGTSGQVLSTNGTGTLSWQTSSGGGGTSIGLARVIAINAIFP